MRDESLGEFEVTTEQYPFLSNSALCYLINNLNSKFYLAALQLRFIVTVFLTVSSTGSMLTVSSTGGITESYRE